MGKTKSSEGSVSRRSFIGACGAVAAGAALPVSAVALGATRPSPRWAGAVAAQVEALRPTYLREIERFAETLRPGFESGELRAYRDGDDDRSRKPEISWDEMPQGKLEALCAAHFGLWPAGTDTRTGYQGDAAMAHVILAVSPYGEALEEASYDDVCSQAAQAAGWDVIAIARRRGWYVPDREEAEDPAWAGARCPDPDCEHSMWAHEEKGCRFGDCNCKRGHVPHVPGFVA